MVEIQMLHTTGCMDNAVRQVHCPLPRHEQSHRTLQEMTWPLRFHHLLCDQWEDQRHKQL